MLTNILHCLADVKIIQTVAREKNVIKPGETIHLNAQALRSNISLMNEELATALQTESRQRARAQKKLQQAKRGTNAKLPDPKITEAERKDM